MSQSFGFVRNARLRTSAHKISFKAGLNQGVGYVFTKGGIFLIFSRISVYFSIFVLN